MSVSKRKYEEMLEEQSDKELASILGISYDELCQLEWDVDTNESSDGLIYDYIYTFRDDSNLEILKKIQGIDIEGRYVYLQPWEFESDYYESEIAWYIESPEQLSVLENHLNSIISLTKIVADEPTKIDLFVMLHAHVIAAMEEFLSGTFIHEITNSDELMKKLIETDSKLGKKLKDKKHKDRQMIVAKKYLNNLIFHRLKKTKQMYKQVLDIDFKNTDWLDTAIKVRHHCVHRAGSDKEGKRVNITKESIIKLVDDCKELSTLISLEIGK
ncbi:hypothetical protein [bacterium endosymbiont of Bathymodiolus sp. 5 South]|uniref:hypothetical protein n=1 Tax=bacterium endosymbiont of Bathymodiolus sp. 5 South TaxID=1181670 RepID=UPI0010B44E87|nr:hypothetical protein [bacterium endosymbiont of Bathymodiolus sp. 5 South]SHN90984.1 hypothetical protein BCLUESOX_1202 [bacterium endosymbiont of Bathymodiolus sp. 5 South]